MIKRLSKIFCVVLILFSCNTSNNYHDKIQGDWISNDSQRCISFMEDQYTFGFIYDNYDKYKIIGDSLFLALDGKYLKYPFIIQRLSDKLLWLRQLNVKTEDSLLIYHNINSNYTSNISYDKIEFTIIPDGNFQRNYMNISIENKNIFVRVINSLTQNNEDNEWPIENGTYIGDIPTYCYNNLITKIRNIPYSKLHYQYDGSYMLKDDNKKLTFYITGRNLPAELRLLTSYIMNLNQFISLKKIKQDHLFELDSLMMRTAHITSAPSRPL